MSGTPVALAAAWMQSEIDTHGVLYQEEALHEMIKRFGATCHCENDSGNVVIAKAVLTAFTKLNAKTVVWERSGLFWRKRVSTDAPGRLQS